MVKNLLGKPVFRDSPAEHSARRRRCLIYRHSKAAVGEVSGSRQSSGAGADYPNLPGTLGRSLFSRQGDCAGFDHFNFFIRGEPFQKPDGNGFVYGITCAGRFARMIAGTAAYGR